MTSLAEEDMQKKMQSARRGEVREEEEKEQATRDIIWGRDLSLVERGQG
jgi:hypothetical protein